MNQSTALAVTSTALSPYTPTNIAEAQALAKMYAASRILGASYGTPESVMLVMATGADLGLSPTAALRGLYVVEGRIYMSADLMVALVLSSPVCERFDLVESTAETCTYEVQRKGGKPAKFTFNEADKKSAGLGATHTKYPAVMKRHRAAAQACRTMFPDVILGMYAEEEREDIEQPRDVGPATTVGPLTSIPKGATPASSVIEAEFVETKPVETEEQTIARFKAAIAAATSRADLKPVHEELSTHAKGTRVRAELTPIFTEKNRALKAAETPATTGATAAGTAAVLAQAQPEAAPAIVEKPDPRIADWQSRIARAGVEELEDVFTGLNDAFGGNVPAALLEQYTAREQGA